jgi:CubicO group peptidase (beta-lactamase class C family)
MNALRPLTFAAMTIASFFSFTMFAHAQEVKHERLLPELVKIADEDGKKVYNICEICDGVSETAVIRDEIRCHNTYSIAKLFTCTAIGILEDQGKLNVDDPVYPIFEKKFPANFDPNWKKVTISDVMRHRAGFATDSLDIDTNNAAEWKDRNFLNIVLSQPLPNEPGSKFVYTDATFYLASRIVSEITGEPLNQFMIRELLEPLQFAEYAFSTDPEGFPIGATGMYISTEDMAKLGQLYVQDGVYNGKRILSKEFVDKAFERNFELNPLDKEGNAFAKGGMNGQYLYMNRKTKRVVALHSFNADVGAIVKYVLEHDK